MTIRALLMNSLARQFTLITVASVLVSSSAFALTSSDAEALTQKIASTKVAELSATSSKLVARAEQSDRVETAKVAVLAVAKSHPTALSSVITAVLRKAPEATETVVAAAIEAAPEMAKTIVSAATFATEGKDEVILSVADRLVPTQKAAVRAEVSSVAIRKALKGSSAKAIIVDGSGATQNPLGGPAPTPVGAYAGRDPNRP